MDHLSPNLNANPVRRSFRQSICIWQQRKAWILPYLKGCAIKTSPLLRSILALSSNYSYRNCGETLQATLRSILLLNGFNPTEYIGLLLIRLSQSGGELNKTIQYNFAANEKRNTSKPPRASLRTSLLNVYIRIYGVSMALSQCIYRSIGQSNRTILYPQEK